MLRSLSELPQLLLKLPTGGHAVAAQSGVTLQAGVRRFSELVQQQQQQDRSFLSWLSHSTNSRIVTPLTEPLPKVNLSPPFRASDEPPPTDITVLNNGVRIISEASPGPTSSLGIYVNSGSIYENHSNSGSSAILECLAFKSTKHRSATRIMKEVEKNGSNIMANASREQMSYTIDCLKTGVPSALELVCDSVLNPLLEPAEVEEQKQRLLALLSNKDVQMTLLNELLIRAAYQGALANPLIPDVEQLGNLTPDVIREFLAKNYVGPRIVLAAAGVDHGELVQLAKPMLEQVPSAEPVPEPSSQYKGGYMHLPGSSEHANLLLAFEYKGGWRNVQGAVIMTVLTYLLGGGNSFSSGGPGKGMHSRLYTRVLNHYSWVHSCTAFNSTFNDSGLMGIQSACDPGNANDMLNVMCHELEAVARSINTVELDRAKRAAISIIYNALESKATSAEDIGRQFLTYGRRISGRQYVDMIQAVTPLDVAQFAAKLLDSRPSLAVFGDNVESVSYDTLLSRYSSSSPAQRSTGGPGSKLRQVLRFGPSWQ